MKPGYPDTRFVGQHIIRLSVVNSTNNYASELFKSDQWSEGTAIIAESQNAGRGQRGAVWQSLSGQNLLVSFMLTPSGHGISGTFDLNKAVAVALRETVSGFFSSPVWVKWPNDILTLDGKLAGILIENQMTGERAERTVVGIGINVNQSGFMNLRATSLRLLSGQTIAVDEVFYELCRKLEFYYSLLINGQKAIIEDLYNKHLWGMGKVCRFADNLEEFSAEVMGTDEFGRLVLKMEDSILRHFDVKSIIWED